MPATRLLVQVARCKWLVDAVHHPAQAVVSVFAVVPAAKLVVVI
jgi:hypothetical protein